MTEENGRLTDGTYLVVDAYYGVLAILLLNHVMHKSVCIYMLTFSYNSHCFVKTWFVIILLFS